MKTFKAICAASIIALSLSIPAYADTLPGDVHIPGKPCPVTDGTETAPAAPGDTEAAVEGDIIGSALADMMWTLASIF